MEVRSDFYSGTLRLSLSVDEWESDAACDSEHLVEVVRSSKHSLLEVRKILFGDTKPLGEWNTKVCDLCICVAVKKTFEAQRLIIKGQNQLRVNLTALV